MRPPRAILLALMAALALPALTAAQGKPAKPARPADQAGATAREADASPWDILRRDRDRDQAIIRDWLRTADPAGLPPGLAKRESLPPGLAKQLRERGTLPPGLDKKLQPLPADLARRLSPLPPDTRRGWLGDLVIEFEVRTGVAGRILQIL